MKRNEFLLMFIIILFSSLNGQGQDQTDNVKVLFVLPARFGLNTNLTRECFDKYGWEVTTAGMTRTVSPCNTSSSVGGRAVTVDTLISEIADITSFDALVIGQMSWQMDPNTAYNDLRNSQMFCKLVRDADSAGLVISASCAGVRVLAAAGILEGRTVTGRNGPNNMYGNEYLAAKAIFVGEGARPVTDGNLVTTTRGQYYQIENFEALLAAVNAKMLKKKSLK
jgi:putative intracellular protease/amidase